MKGLINISFARVQKGLTATQKKKKKKNISFDVVTHFCNLKNLLGG